MLCKHITHKSFEYEYIAYSFEPCSAVQDNSATLSPECYRLWRTLAAAVAIVHTETNDMSYVAAFCRRRSHEIIFYDKLSYSI